MAKRKKQSLFSLKDTGQPEKEMELEEDVEPEAVEAIAAAVVVTTFEEDSVMSDGK